MLNFKVTYKRHNGLHCYKHRELHSPLVFCVKLTATRGAVPAMELSEAEYNAIPNEEHELAVYSQDKLTPGVRDILAQHLANSKT